MKIVSVVLEDFASFVGRHEFVFADRGLTMVLGENLDEPQMNSNGSGKSTLFKALDWGLFGVVPSGSHADSIVNDEVQRGCGVTVNLLEDDGTPLQVIRGRPSSLQLFENGEELTTLDTKETQKILESKLGLDREVFHAAVLFAQEGRYHFADATDSGRMEILSKIIPELRGIDQYLATFKEKRKGLAGDRDQLSNQIIGLRGELEGVSNQVDFSEEKAEWELGRRDTIKSYEAKIQETQEQIAYWKNAGTQVPELQKYLASLQANLPSQSEPSQHQTQLELAQENLSRVGAALGHTTARIGQVERSLNKIRSTGVGDCPECGQEVTAEHLQQEASRLEVEASVLEAERQQHAQAQMGWVAERDRLKAVIDVERAQRHASVQAQATQIAQTQSDLNGIINWASEVARYESEEQGLRMGMEAERSKVNPFVAKEEASKVRLDVLKKDIKKLEKKISSLDEEISYYDFWVTGFGPKGLKSYILDSNLQDMTDSANEVVKILTGGTFWVRFESQKKGRTTRRLSNAPSIRVFKWNPNGSVSERDYRTWSGGQKSRVSLGIDLGLSSLVGRRASKKYDMLILDEIFKYVDAKGREAVVQLLHSLRQKKSSVFVVEHDAEFQGHFENTVLVRYQNSRSTIVEDECGQELSSEGQAKVRGSGSNGKAKPRRKAANRRVPRRAATGPG